MSEGAAFSLVFLLSLTYFILAKMRRWKIL